MRSTTERIAIIRDFPQQLEQLTAHLTRTQLTTAYHEGEWTIAQNVHHVADAHMQGFIRFKLALTEDMAKFSDYDRDAFAALPDGSSHDIATSLGILHGLHARWVVLLENVSDWHKTFLHPRKGEMTLDTLLTLYADHCHAHLAQIRAVMERM